jgi:hypothetical protein
MTFSCVEIPLTEICAPTLTRKLCRNDSVQASLNRRGDFQIAAYTNLSGERTHEMQPISTGVGHMLGGFGRNAAPDHLWKAFFDGR